MINRCRWPDCETPVPADRFMCRLHWNSLPKRLRDLVWETHGSDEATSTVFKWIKEATMNEPREKP